jgi:putative hydrolase of the HAD superfamily
VMRRDRIFRRVLEEEGYSASLEKIHSAYVGADSWHTSTYESKVLSPEETDEVYRLIDEKVFSTLFPAELRTEALRVSRRVRKRWPELHSEIPLELFPDVEPTLARLKHDGHRMGLVSNAPSDTGKVVDALGIGKYLDSVVISGVVGYSKPNPEIFRIALREVGAEADEAVHVGDVYEADVVGARNAGMKGILIDRDGSNSRLDCPRIASLPAVYSYLD